MSEINICDKCGERISDPTHLEIRWVNKIFPRFTENRVELCPKCADQLKALLAPVLVIQ